MRAARPASSSAARDVVGEGGVGELARRDVDGDLERRASQPRGLARTPRAGPTRRSSTMRPLCSATGMKRSGGTMPSSGWSQRSSASTPVMRPVAQLDERLVVEAQLAALDRRRAARPRARRARRPARAARRRRPRRGALPSSLARYIAASASRSSSAASASAAVRREADADRGGDEALLAVEHDRGAQGAGDAVGDAAGVGDVAADARCSRTANSSPPKRAMTSSGRRTRLHALGRPRRAAGRRRRGRASR